MTQRPWRVPMIPRSPDQEGRKATPLGLFFDLVFVVAVAFAASELHHALVDSQFGDAVLGYLLVIFLIWWAWMNFAWFASAYTDDVPYRVAILVGTGGALILADRARRGLMALRNKAGHQGGIPWLFASPLREMQRSKATPLISEMLVCCWADLRVSASNVHPCDHRQWHERGRHPSKRRPHNLIGDEHHCRPEQGEEKPRQHDRGVAAAHLEDLIEITIFPLA